MECAEAFARCSVGERLRVGTVIVKNNRIISCGYNALPEHLSGALEEKEYMKSDAGGWLDVDWIEEQYPHEDESGRYRLTTKPEVRHSEKNALMGLIKSNESAVGSSMFCTNSCCKMCAIDIVDAGVTEFYYKYDYRSDEGLKHLISCGLKVIKLPH